MDLLGRRKSWEIIVFLLLLLFSNWEGKKAGFDNKQDDENSYVTGVDLRADIRMENGYSTTVDGFRLTTPSYHSEISQKLEPTVSSHELLRRYRILFKNIHTLFYNKSFKHGIFPDILKIAIILKVPEEGIENKWLIIDQYHFFVVGISKMCKRMNPELPQGRIYGEGGW